MLPTELFSVPEDSTQVPSAPVVQLTALPVPKRPLMVAPDTPVDRCYACPTLAVTVARQPFFSLTLPAVSDATATVCATTGSDIV